MAERLEPLQALVQRIVQRPRQRQQYKPVDFEEVNGAMRGIPQGIAGADDAQSFDISSPIAPTQPIFARGEEDGGPETPVQLASGGRGESNPFQFAPGGAQPQMRQTSGGMQFRQDCSGGQCRMVPVVGGQAAPSMALPPGVVLGPGETFVPGSLRETAATPQQAPAAMAAPAQMTPPPLAPSGPSPIPEAQSPMDFLRNMAEGYRQDRERYESDAARNYAEAQAALANRDAIGFVQADERGDLYAQAGINAAALFGMSQQALANQGNIDRLFDERQKKARAQSLEGRLEEEAAIIGARGRSVPVRAQRMFELRTAVAAAQQRPMDEQTATRTMDMIEGEIYATDASGYYLDYRQAVARWQASGGKDDDALQAAYALRAESYGTLMRRYGNATNRQDLERRMRAELTPIFRARYADFYAKNPELLPSGVTTSGASIHANKEAVLAVGTAIAAVANYLETGKNPYEAAIPPARSSADEQPQEEE